MTAQKCVRVCVWVMWWCCWKTRRNLSDLLYYSLNFFFFCRIQLLPGKLLPVNDSSTNVGTAGVTLHNWRTSAAARLWRARSVRSGCGLWVGIDSKKSHLMEDRPDSAPPASSTVTTLFTPHKQAGRPPRFEAALCYCRKLRGSS